MGVPPFTHVNPYYPQLTFQAVLEETNDCACIAVVPASTVTQTHAKLEQCLGEFLRLYDALEEPGRVLTFVHRYGLAGFCPHVFEPGGSEGIRTSIPWRQFVECPECLSGWRAHRHEPIRAYVMCSRQLRAALKTAAALRIIKAEAKENQEKEKRLQKKSTHVSDVKSLFFDEQEHEFFFTLEVELQWQQLAFVAYSWIDWSKPPIWPSVSKDGDGVSVQIRAYTLMHLLALQFAAAISAREGWYVCDVCSNPFASSRKPRHGVRTLCQICSVSPDVANERKRKSWNKKLDRPRQRKSKFLGDLPGA